MLPSKVRLSPVLLVIVTRQMIQADAKTMRKSGKYPISPRQSASEDAFLIAFITILIEEEKSKLGSLPTSVSFVPFRELIHNLADTAS